MATAATSSTETKKKKYFPRNAHFKDTFGVRLALTNERNERIANSKWRLTKDKRVVRAYANVLQLSEKKIIRKTFCVVARTRVLFVAIEKKYAEHRDMPLENASGNVIRFWVAEANAKQRNAHIKSGCTVNGHQRKKKHENCQMEFFQLSKIIIMTQPSLLQQCELCMKSRRCKRNSTFLPEKPVLLIFFFFKTAHINCYLLAGMSTQLDIQANAENSTSSHEFEKDMD